MIYSLGPRLILRGNLHGRAEAVGPGTLAYPVPSLE